MGGCGGGGSVVAGGGVYSVTPGQPLNVSSKSLLLNPKQINVFKSVRKKYLLILGNRYWTTHQTIPEHPRRHFN
jgi:hypothetical protein